MAAVAVLRHDPLLEQVSDYCARRTECEAACSVSNFPYLNCEERKVSIEYNGNTYTDFFFYPKPTLKSSKDELEHYNQCKGYIKDVSVFGNYLSLFLDVERWRALHALR